MRKPNVKELANKLQTNLVKNSPKILFGIGIAGVATTVVLSVKATPKAMSLIEEEKKAKKKDKLTAAETVKVAWKPYIPALISGGISLGCLFGSTSINFKRTAALTAAYKLSETALSELKEAAIETVGEKKMDEIKSKIHEKKIEQNPITPSTIIYTPENGFTLCYDTLSGRYFKSNAEKISKAITDLNFKLLDEGYISLNDYFESLGLEGDKLGELLGWNLDSGKIEYSFDTKLNGSTEPCLIIDIDTMPKSRYYKFEY